MKKTKEVAAWEQCIMGFGEARKMDNLVSQEGIKFVLAHGRWTFDWCQKDKQIFSCGIDTYLYWCSMKLLYQVQLSRVNLRIV